MSQQYWINTRECSDPSCPCHEWSAKSPSLTYYGHPRLDTGLEIDSGAVSDVGTSPPVSTFDREWASAPTVATRYTERSIGEYWFLRGMRAEYLGPVSLEGFEQLIQLRKVAGLTLKMLDDADYGLDVYSLAPNLRSAAKALREALAPKTETEAKP